MFVSPYKVCTWGWLLWCIVANEIVNENINISFHPMGGPQEEYIGRNLSAKPRAWGGGGGMGGVPVHLWQREERHPAEQQVQPVQEAQGLVKVKHVLPPPPLSSTGRGGWTWRSHRLYREGPGLALPGVFPSCTSLWSDLRLNNREGKPAGGKWQFSSLDVESAEGGSSGIFTESRCRCGPQDAFSFLLVCAGRSWPVWSTRQTGVLCTSRGLWRKNLTHTGTPKGHSVRSRE